MSVTLNDTPNRSYPMSKKTRLLLDNLDILIPGKSKSELINIAVSYLVMRVKEIRGGDKNYTYTMALDVIIKELGKIDYQELAKTLIPDNKNNTKLDDFIGIELRIKEEQDKMIQAAQNNQEASDDVSDDESESEES